VAVTEQGVVTRCEEVILLQNLSGNNSTNTLLAMRVFDGGFLKCAATKP
jgi:hypothetical protein